jgi:cytosine deaminase
VALLCGEGVVAFNGSDNIRDSSWPDGDGDMLRRIEIIGYRSGFHTDADLAAPSTCSSRLAARADVVTPDAAHIPLAVISVPKGRRVVKAGRLVAEDGRVL